MSTASKGNNSYRLTIYGKVQGVGFRPSVYRVARSLDIRGRVSNTPEGAVIEAEGTRSRIDLFRKELLASLPPRAAVSSIRTERIPYRHFPDFSIETSRGGEKITAELPADLALCENCRRELFTPSDRRYRYPFINCTDCGPRFSIVRSLPYDRPQTTMSSFAMCPDCKREYEDPSDRRFHAQPDACPACGPKVRLLSPDFDEIADGDEALEQTIRLLRSGKIIAIKSLGGYHLACSAENRRAVRTLRERKKRPHKPFALMLPDAARAARVGRVGPAEKQALESAAAPIVLLEKRPNGPLTTLDILAPGNAYIGVMLPYTPLHHLLFSGKKPIGALVMTSGNRHDEPICITEEDAKEKLSRIADYFLVHDRHIHNRCDDSLVQCLPSPNNTMTVIRRSRGYVPEPVVISGASKAAKTPVVLSVGAELKNTFCLTRGGNAYVSPYIGDLDNSESLAFFNESLERFRDFLKVKPSVIAHDLHPDYLSSIFARELLAAKHGAKGVAVQHHHAHIASVLAEENLTRPVIGFAFDGTGLGTDGAVWGGECLLAHGARFERLAHFDYFPLPGGDAATREIWRLAVSLLGHAGIADLPETIRRTRDWQMVRSMIKSSVNTPACCSAGRIFDAVAAIAGLKDTVSFEAQAAMELEALAAARGGLDFRSKKEYTFEVVSRQKSEPDVVTLDGIVKGVWEDTRAGKDPAVIALAFHRTMAEVIGTLAARYGKKLGIRDVVLSGGVFQNRLLLSLAVRRLSRAGFTVHFNRIVPANDGGISLGQAWVALRQ